ncbi:MAG: hypothetical protein AVDCRST_MAG86-784 [uncultured Truepera sp.]|uniref:Polymerase nucleotidyl transferase domain-containing protein n=1 Tax=uncultured Truepera sp. TaxID=543023 RepID=A0A6J4UXX5_9DEIN|nr:MAG: hypothetical protein AVDCRST_MAG86-784 [uncultured Truepera sp.]
MTEFDPEAVFGSYVRGEPGEDSDLDVLLVLKGSPGSPTKRAARAYNVLWGIRMPVDVLVKTQAELERFRGVRSSFTADILQNGRKLYGKSHEGFVSR